MKCSCEPALGCEERREALHPQSQCLEGLVTLREIDSCVCAVVDFATKDSGDQVRPLREVPVHRAQTHACLVGNGANGSIHSLDGENVFGRLQQGIQTTLRIRTHGFGRPFASPSDPVSIYTP